MPKYYESVQDLQNKCAGFLLQLKLISLILSGIPGRHVVNHRVTSVFRKISIEIPDNNNAKKKIISSVL